VVDCHRVVVDAGCRETESGDTDRGNANVIGAVGWNRNGCPLVVCK
jgi:hypothetical protein